MCRWPQFLLLYLLKILLSTAVSVVKKTENFTSPKCDDPRGFYADLNVCQNRCTLEDYGCRASKSLQRCFECVYTSHCYTESDCDSDCPKGYQCEKAVKTEDSEDLGCKEEEKPFTCVKALPEGLQMEHWVLALIVFGIIFLTLLICVPCVICFCLPFMGITYKADFCPKSCSKFRYHRTREA